MACRQGGNAGGNAAVVAACERVRRDDDVYRRVSDGSLPVLRLSEHGAIRIPATALDEFARPSESLVRAPRTPTGAVEPLARDGGTRKEEA
jgi:hypothetical protein